LKIRRRVFPGLPAAMISEHQPTICRLRFGNFEITTILDSKITGDGLQASFACDRTLEDVQKLCRVNHIDPDRFEHSYIPTVIDTGKQLVLFDTGNGALRREQGELYSDMPDGHLAKRLVESGYRLEDIDVVVLSHGHPDHIGGLVKGGRPVFPNARTVFSAAEFDFWKRGEKVREERKSDRELFLKMVLPLAERSSFIKPGDEIVPGIRAVDAAGHSAGMIACHVESEGKRLLIWADTCIHHVLSVQRPEWQAAVDDDKDKAAATRKRLLDMAASEKLFVAGFHMPFPGIGMIEKPPGGCRWVPASDHTEFG
jgi:glyoxylase-like metal-dependent hydrolase (beta-lactamase superfamily II)